MAEPVRDTAPPVAATSPVNDSEAPAAAGPESSPESGPSNDAFGLLAEGGFLARFGPATFRLDAADLLAEGGIDLEGRPQPIPGVHLKRAEWSARNSRLTVNAELRVPHLEGSEFRVRVNEHGTPSIVGRLRSQLDIPALGSPVVAIGLSEEGNFGATVEIDRADLRPRGLRNLTVTGGGTLILADGRFSGNVDADLAYAGLGSGEIHLGFSEAGAFSGSGSLALTPPFMEEVTANLAIDEANNVAGDASLTVAEVTTPIPGLTLTAGTLSLAYANGAIDGSIAGFTASYEGLATATLDAQVENGTFSGEGSFDLAVPGVETASGVIRVRAGTVSGSLRIAASKFGALPISDGTITATLGESGRVGLEGGLTVDLGPGGEGRLEASYSETGEFAISSNITLTIPGLGEAQISVAYADGDISGEAAVPIDTEVLPGISGDVTVRYEQNLWSGETDLAYAADDGKLSGSVHITVQQNDAGGLELGGSGSVTAQLAPRLSGTLTATILPEGGVDVSGAIEVTEPLELFPEQSLDRELVNYAQNIPLWAILVAVIRVRAGVRAGIGPGVFRNIRVEGSYTIGQDEADPSFSISGEMFIPAFVEGYVAFGAGLGLDVVLGSLTGGIEGVATAGLYGAISVVPELSYEDGDWGIEGTATLAAGARLKLGLNAWAEIEALWITVWSEEWELAEYVMPIGPDLALQARMNYKFGQPLPPEIEFNSSDIDTESLIQSAMPKEGPAPSGAREALENRAEWQGALREQRDPPVPPEVAAQANATEQPPEPQGRPQRSDRPPDARTNQEDGDVGAQRSQQPDRAQPDQPPGVPQSPNSRAGESEAPQPGQARREDVAAAGDRPANRERALPESEAPATDQPRYPQAVTMRTLDESPARTPRTAREQQLDIDAASDVVSDIERQVDDTDALVSYFPSIKRRFALSRIALESQGDRGAGVAIEINPFTYNPVSEKLRGADLTRDDGFDLQTEVTFYTDDLGGSTVGTKMEATLLGPDHPLGSGPSGQDALMGMLRGKGGGQNKNYVRGHLLNDVVGGPGRAKNLFPITQRANQLHEQSIENQVKTWVNKDKFWVAYSVVVAMSQSRLVNPPPSEDYNFVTATFTAKASVLTTDRRELLTREVVIRSNSVIGQDSTASGTETGVGGATAPIGDTGLSAETALERQAIGPRDNRRHSAQAFDMGLEIAEPARLTGNYVLDSRIVLAIQQIRRQRRQGFRWAWVSDALNSVPGIGPSHFSMLKRMHVVSPFKNNLLNIDHATSLDSRERALVTEMNSNAGAIAAKIIANGS